MLAYFAAELKRHRVAAGYSQAQLGEACLTSTSLVGAIETARRMPSRDFAERADTTLGTDGTFTRPWPLVGREGHPSYFRPFAEHEASATLLREFEPLAVPGLLQTETYARALVTRPSATADQVEELVNARIERQAVLDKESAPTLVVLLDESVLSRR